MRRVKKKKKAIVDKPAKTPLMYVTQTNYVNLAIMVRVMYMCYGWRKKRLDNLCEAYVALIDEWRAFCKWIRTLPYSKLITGEFEGRHI